MFDSQAKDFWKFILFFENISGSPLTFSKFSLVSDLFTLESV